MLVTSIFSLPPHNIFYHIKERICHLATLNLSSAYILNLVYTKILSFSKVIINSLGFVKNLDLTNLIHVQLNSLEYYAVKIYSCGKHLRKDKIAWNKLFLLFSQCFLPYMVLILHFKCT